MRLKYLIPVALFAAGPASAAPIDGTFNYQGRLTSGGAPITGTADVRFSLWDSSNGGVQVGGFKTFLGRVLTDGLFNVPIDWPVSAFDGERRWLQIEVRSPAGVGSYVDLGRQEIRGTPYAIQTRGLFVDDSLNVGVGTTTPQADLHVGGPEATLLVQDEAQDNAIVLDGTGDPNAALGGVSPLRHLIGGAYAQELVGGPNGGQYHAYNAATGELTAAVGTSFGTGGGFFELFDGNVFLPTVSFTADKDLDPGNGKSEGQLMVGSVNGGEGGEVSLLNDDGNETIELLGGAGNNNGTINFYHYFTGDPNITLSASSIGGRISTFSEDGSPQAYWEPDVNGEGVYAVWRRTNGSNGMTFDGSFGGTGNPAMYIEGASQSVAFNMNNAGSSSVMLPTEAIQDTEILDEPGVAAHNAGSTSMGTGLIETLISRSITVPSSGYVLVLAQGDLSISHSNGTVSDYSYGVSDSSTTIPGNQDIQTRLNGPIPSGTYDFSASAHGVFPVSAGTHTFYFNGRKISGISATMFDLQLTLVFLPTAYGTVTPTLLARGDNAGNDLSVPPPPGLTPEEIRAEQREAVAFDQNRRATEAADYAAQIAELRAQLQQVLREQELMRQEMRRASPPPDTRGATLGAALNHNDTQSR